MATTPIDTSPIAHDPPGSTRLPIIATTPDGHLEIRDRIDTSLDKLESLAQQLIADDDYVVDPLPFELPTGFLLSVVIPVYNEHKTIAGVLARLRALPLPLEIIVVDDESTDGTVEKLEQIRELMDITVLFKPRNQGKGAALRTGFRHATGDIVVVQDADMEYDPRDIPALIEPIVKKQADIVYGSRFLEHGAVGSSWIHRFGNRFLTRFSNLFTRLRLTDMETCYKAFPRKLLQQLELKQHRFGFEPEVTAKVARSGATVCELPIRYAARDWQEGKKIGLRDGINAVYCILRYAILD